MYFVWNKLLYLWNKLYKLKVCFLSCENDYNECFVRYNIINKQEKEEGILIHKKLDKFKEDFYGEVLQQHIKLKVLIILMERD